MSDQKCIYQYSAGNFCGVIASDHTGVHFFQPPLEISAEAVEAFQESGEYLLDDSTVRVGLEAALRVMQKGQDE
jgi:hypothetical protein